MLLHSTDEQEPDWLTVPFVDLPDEAVLEAADFDGDWIDDVASPRGVMKTKPRELNDDTYRVTTPWHEYAEHSNEENATLAGVFNDDQFVDLVTAHVRETDTSTRSIELVMGVTSPYGDIDDTDRPVVLVCSDVSPGDCGDLSAWSVMIGRGDIDGSAREEIVVLARNPAGGVSVALAYRIDDADVWQEVTDVPVEIGVLVTPDTMAVGALFPDEDGRDDIVIGGHQADGTATIVVIHWTGSEYGIYSLVPPIGPASFDFPESHIGDFFPDRAGNEVAFVSESGEVTLFGAIAGCLPSDPCIEMIDFPTFIVSGTVHGVSAGDRGDGVSELNLLVSVDHGVAMSVMLYTASWGATGWVVSEELVRSFPFEACSGSATDGCFEPPLGPLAGDVDEDGASDALIGWNQGRTWEAVGSVSGARLFGATASERGSHALTTDIDDNGLIDVILFEDGEDSDVWMLGQELDEPPAEVISVD
jgi:hypothetical protein